MVANFYDRRKKWKSRWQTQNEGREKKKTES